MAFYGWDTPDVIYLYSASGVLLRQVYSTMQLMGIIRDTPELIFDTGDTEAEASIASREGHFRFSFRRNVQSQDIISAYERYIGIPDRREDYLERRRKREAKRRAKP